MTPTEAFDRIQELLAEVNRLMPIAWQVDRKPAETVEAESEGGDHD